MSIVPLGRLPAVGPAALCMGVFDGVHPGHRALVATTVRAAHERGLASVALLFDPPPIEVIRPDQRVPRLAPPGENLRRLAAAGIDHPIGMAFTDEVRQLPPEAFLAALAPSIELRALVLTPDSAFGRGRAGTPEAMRALGATAGFEVVMLDDLTSVDGEPVSSSRARAAIATGDVEGATRLLGQAPFLAGTVVRGDGRDEPDDPTATLRFDYLPALPARGVYAARATVPSASIGPGHPAIVVVDGLATPETAAQPRVEVHLLDVDADLRDARLELELVAQLRDMERFETGAAAADGRRDDERRARSLLGS